MKPALTDLAARIERATQKIAPTLITERLEANTLSETAGGTANAPTAPGQNLSLSETAEHLALRAEHFATLTAATSQALRMKAPPPVAPTPRELLQVWSHANAIFFGIDTEFRNSQRAGIKLEKLAQLIKDADNNVRIVGFTDVKGALESNYTLSLARASKIKSILVSKGVKPYLLGIVGRLNAKEISPVVGELSPNRRVEFELGFIGERTR